MRKNVVLVLPAGASAFSSRDRPFRQGPRSFAIVPLCLHFEPTGAGLGEERAPCELGIVHRLGQDRRDVGRANGGVTDLVDPPDVLSSHCPRCGPAPPTRFSCPSRVPRPSGQAGGDVATSRRRPTILRNVTRYAVATKDDRPADAASTVGPSGRQRPSGCGIDPLGAHGRRSGALSSA